MCFLANQPARAYLLGTVCVRLVLKMGLHRDPSKLPGTSITHFDGQMHRQILESGKVVGKFSPGLPNMGHKINRHLTAAVPDERGASTRTCKDSHQRDQNRTTPT